MRLNPTYLKWRVRNLLVQYYSIQIPLQKIFKVHIMKDVLYEVRCLKSNEDMILALTEQFKQLSHEPEQFR